MFRTLASRLCLAGMICLTTACVEATDGEPVSTGESEVFTPAGVRFEKLFSCDGGAAYVDVNVTERRFLQLVVKDPAILGYLHRSRAVSLPFGATEASFRGYTGVVFYQDFGPKLKSGNGFNGRGVFQPSEFSHFIAEYIDFQVSTPLVNVYREGNGLRVVWGAIEELDCARSVFIRGGDGAPDRNECQVRHSRFVERANWYFQSCTF
jgi:hypothetical protein